LTHSGIIVDFRTTVNHPPYFPTPIKDLPGLNIKEFMTRKSYDCICDARNYINRYKLSKYGYQARINLASRILNIDIKSYRSKDRDLYFSVIQPAFLVPSGNHISLGFAPEEQKSS
jgi:hypothetical protein